MNTRSSLLVSLVSAGLLCAGVATAQDNSMSPPSPSNPNKVATGSATYASPQGQLTVNSSTSRTPSTATPPSFEQLSGGKGAITKDEAAGYPPLANDWEYASHGGQSISKQQYEAWLKHLN